jgi:hypothetical protein
MFSWILREQALQAIIASGVLPRIPIFIRNLLLDELREALKILL